MPNRTFAFSHRGGYWKTRYSFFSNCYAYVNKVLLSFRVTMAPTQRDPVWRHNLGGFTNFYGDQGGAGFSVSFNANPSENKILKSISVEATNNSNPASIVVANNSTTDNQSKVSPVIAFDDKGGILYGHIQGQNINTNGNVKYMGTLLATQAQEIVSVGTSIVIRAPFQWANGGGSNVTQGSKYVWSPVGNDQVYATSLNTPIDLTDDYGSVPDAVQYNGMIDDNIADFSFAFAADAILPFLSDPFDFDVYSVSPNITYGDMLKGQYADAVFTFPGQDWELFSVNLEYEPTTYDHSEAPRMSASRGSRRRRR